MSSACDSCPSKSGCTSKESCPSLNGPQKNPEIKTVIGIASGKGGVGKSFVTAMLGSALSKKGYKVGILDADITGPSIPRAFGLTEKLTATEDNKLVPVTTKGGIKTVSLNLLMPDEKAPVIWRGPVLSGVVKQFWEDTDWGMLDVLLIDMPPGTGDVPLTLYQSLPIDGIILVSTPQDLVSMIVSKARNMAAAMKVNVLGLVENMSYVTCPHCGEAISLFGDDSSLSDFDILDKLPLDPSVTALVDSGKTEDADQSVLDNTAGLIEAMIKAQN